MSVGDVRKALDDEYFGEYNSRLSRKRDDQTKISLFDNREWNQNVRGELVVAAGLQGPGAEFKYLYIFNDSDALSYCDSVRQQFGTCELKINLLESLILAQDERWRRA